MDHLIQEILAATGYDSEQILINFMGCQQKTAAAWAREALLHPWPADVQKHLVEHVIKVLQSLEPVISY